MKVLVEFGRAYLGHPSDAVWIVDTPENRSWFKKQLDRIDPNSALFNEGAEPLTIIWDVFEHHPSWTEIVIRGATLTAEEEESIMTYAVVLQEGPYELRLLRP